jgi:CO dehydrogenase/acetyl-CoA synthase beta subunit
MQRIINSLLISCQKATELIDKKSVMKLPLRENTLLHIHTSICNACKQYEKQSKIIDELLKQHFQKTESAQVPQLTNNELKHKVFSLLNKN